MVLHTKNWSLCWVFFTLSLTHFELVTGIFRGEYLVGHLSNVQSYEDFPFNKLPLLSTSSPKFSHQDELFPSKIIDDYPFIQCLEDSQETSEKEGLLTDTTREVHEGMRFSPQNQHEGCEMEGNDMKMYDEVDFKISKILREFDFNHLNFSPLPDFVDKDIENKLHLEDISKDPQKIEPKLKKSTFNSQHQKMFPPDVVSHIPTMETGFKISQKRPKFRNLGEIMEALSTDHLPIPDLEFNDELMRKEGEVRIPQAIQPDSINQPKPQNHVENVWNNKNGGNFHSTLADLNILDEYQDSLLKNNLISTKDIISKEMRNQNKRKRPRIEKYVVLESPRKSNSNHASDCYHNEVRGGINPVFSSKESLCDNSRNTPTRKVLPETKKTDKLFTPREDTNIYRNQARTSFDNSIKKHVIPFMRNLEDFFQEGMDMRQRNWRCRSYLIKRLRLMTHEFLLSLVKVDFTFDPEGKELDHTLLEGFKWLTSVWKSIPIETFIQDHAPQFTQHAEAYKSTTTIEETLISKVMSSNLFARSQHKFIAYVLLNWIQKFRPSWFETLNITPTQNLLMISVYNPNLAIFQDFLSLINSNSFDLKKGVELQ